MPVSEDVCQSPDALGRARDETDSGIFAAHVKVSRSKAISNEYAQDSLPATPTAQLFEGE